MLCKICFLLAGVIIMVVATVVFRIVLIQQFKKDNQVRRFNFPLLLLYVISADFCLAMIAKKAINAYYLAEEGIQQQERVERSKQARARYIKNANIHNLFLSLILSVLTFLLFVSCVHCDCCPYLQWFVYGFFGYRLLSRTFEINVSFFKDCFDREHESNLDRYDRIKLAFKSLLEETVLFTALYSFAKLKWWEALLGGLHSLILSPYSVGYNSAFFKFVAVYQVICTIVLLTIAFATYVSTPDQPNRNANNNDNGGNGNNGGDGGNGEDGGNGGNDGNGAAATATATATAVATAAVPNGAARGRARVAAQAIATPNNAQNQLIKAAIVATAVLAVVAVMMKRR